MNPTLQNAAVAVYSNSPYQPTGYGQQSGYLVDRLKRDGAQVAALSNYGIQGNNSKLETPYGEILHYAQSFDVYGNDIHPANFMNFQKLNADKKPILITLYDTWVLDRKAWEKTERILSWTPLDHLTVPEKVLAWISQDKVRPIAMAPFGVQQMNSHDIDCDYIPHSIDTNIYKPGQKVAGKPARETLGINEDVFLVGMVAANKADGSLHRKAFYENLLAFSIFKQAHPEAKIYIHSDAHGSAGGWPLSKLYKAVGLVEDDIIMPHQVQYRWGHKAEDMGGIFGAFDVYLGTSYGEGFGIGTIEAQSAGTPAIVSNFAASPDLIAPEYRTLARDGGLLVEGQPIWHPGLDAPFAVPSVPGIVQALENAYKLDRGTNKTVRAWAKNFDVEKVWNDNWLPVLKRELA